MGLETRSCPGFHQLLTAVAANLYNVYMYITYIVHAPNTQ